MLRSGSPRTFCRVTPWANATSPPVLDAGMLTINLDVIRLTLHVLAATIWVGGQIVLATLTGPLRRVDPAALAPVARAYAWVAWPAFAVLVLTGGWMLADMSQAGEAGEALQATLTIKLLLVALSGIGAALHIFCLLYTSPSPRDGLLSRMPSSA